MPHHLEPVPSGPADEPLDPFGPDDPLWDEDEDEREGGDPAALAPLVRPAWWRWVAIAVILALVVAGPFAVVLFKLLS